MNLKKLSPSCPECGGTEFTAVLIAHCPTRLVGDQLFIDDSEKGAVDLIECDECGADVPPSLFSRIN